MGFQVLLIFSFLVLLFTNIYIEQTMYRKQQYNLRLMFAITHSAGMAPVHPGRGQPVYRDEPGHFT